MFYLIYVANVVNMSHPGACIGGALHALIHILFFTGGLKSSKPIWDLNRGSGGGARGCGFEERAGVHASTGGIQFAIAGLSVCVSVVS